MINNVQIEPIEALLLPKNCHFADDARAVINCWDDANVLACPGSGKTTVLLAKLKILADRMPLAGGRGICILSHTNVAVDEIKKRLKGDSEKILSYPNFAGTIQSFVDTFVVFPFWRSFVKVSLRVVSSSEYAYRSWQLMQNGYQYSSLKGFVSRHCGVNTANETPIKVIEKLSLDNDGSLLISGKKQAGADSKSAQQLKSLNTYLHKNEGLMTYENAFRCASNILKKQGDSFRTLVSKRFKYVFIDEYQDCSNLQCSVLKDLFGGTDAVVQRIGDMDQAIYNSIYDSTNSSWDVSRDCLEISETNRFGNEIASVLSSLRTGHKTIVSARGFFRIKPVLFVYSSGAETKVVDAFVEEIRQTKLAKDGVYKAIGMLRKGSGMTITRYWNHFDKDAVAAVDKNFVALLGVGAAAVFHDLHNGVFVKAAEFVVVGHHGVEFVLKEGDVVVGANNFEHFAPYNEFHFREEQPYKVEHFVVGAPEVSIVDIFQRDDFFFTFVVHQEVIKELERCLMNIGVEKDYRMSFMVKTPCLPARNSAAMRAPKARPLRL